MNFGRFAFSAFLSGFCLFAAGCSWISPDTKQEASPVSKNAVELIDEGDFEGAVALYDQMIAENPENVSAYVGKGIVFDKAGNHVAAQGLYKKALSLAPDAVDIKNNLAMSLILNNEPKKAIEILKPLVVADYENPTLRHNLAMAYGMSGQKQKALTLNLRDMSKKEALENQKIYDEMAAKKFIKN